MTLVTTIIPAYNAADFIREAVDSALAQTHTDHEIIVVDDGSKDNTGSILATYGDRIRVLKQTNAGHVAARNNAAKMASSEWLAFLDADDAWLPSKLEKQLAIARGDVGMVYTDRKNFGATERVSERASSQTVLWDGDLFEKLLLGNFVTVSSVIIRKDWFEQLGGFDPTLLVCEDWDLWLRFSAQGGMAGVVHEPLTCYRWHGASMTNNQTRMCEGRLKVLERALGSPRGNQVAKRIHNKAKAMVWKCSAWYATPWHKSTAVKWYAKSALYWPWDIEVYKSIIKCSLGVD